jgi:hypothetical protein
MAPENTLSISIPRGSKIGMLIMMMLCAATTNCSVPEKELKPLQKDHTDAYQSALQFRPSELRAPTVLEEDSDVLTKITIYYWLEGCL